MSDLASLRDLMPSGMTPEAFATRLRAELDTRRRQNLVQTYRPYGKQLEFHAAGRRIRERLFRAGNQLGKTFAGAAEAAFHLTGHYPPWWPGRRFEQATRGWVGGPSGELVREGPQRVLLGPVDAWGTGTIPRKSILDVKRATGVKDLVDTITIRSVTGQVSEVKLKTYDQGRERWQAATLDWVWFDEEPPEDIYTEGLSRTNATGGMTYMTFTPLKGVTSVVMKFIKEISPDRADIVMTIDDVTHISPENRDIIIASYPEHERAARTRGVPVLGSGRVYPFPREMIEVEPFAIPGHWGQLVGMDIGWDHPTAAVRLTHDRDNDVVYVINAYRQAQATPAVHAAAIRAWGDVPVAWPHDAIQHDKGSGEQIADLYARNGLSMMHERAQFPDKRGIGVEAGVFEMMDRMQTARLKIFAHLNDWFEEFGLYHRDGGVIVKERDDLLDATRYGIMMLRYATAGQAPRQRYQPTPYRPQRTWRTV